MKYILPVLITLLSISIHASAASSKQILAATGVKNGLIVHVGCGKGELTARLKAGDGCIVHGIDTDPANVKAARGAIRKAGLYGKVSVDTFDGKNLPYADNLVNLIVAEDLGNVPVTEAMRALAPRGIAYIKQGGRWTKTVKPVPVDIDDWTHYLHGPDSNAVARDTVAGPPRRTQWVGGPLFARSHEINSSLAAMISARGRLFYIWDENPIGMTDKRFGENWKLIARDAFNGAVLWKRPIARWDWRQWHAASRWDDHRERAKMLRMLPASLPRRLVAVGNRVYVTLGYTAPVSVLDAETGQELRKLTGTEMTDEILHIDGKLVLRVRTKTSPPEKDVWGNLANVRSQAFLMAVDPKSGKVLWRTKPNSNAPMTMAASGARVCHSDYQRVVCHDLKDGKELWKSETIQGKPGNRGTMGTLVAQEKVVLFTTYGAGKQLPNAGRLHALSAENGKLLWMGPKYRGPGITNPPDLFVADGLVWIGEVPSRMAHTVLELKRQGFDPLTGKVKREITVPKLISWGHHYRCYRSKATERFLILPKRGAEFVDLTGEGHMRHDWLRPPCIYGMLPANGLVYFAPHQCVCYQGVLLSNFNALAPKSTAALPQPATRLQRGPAFGKVSATTPSGKGDWPTYRHDAKRSGLATMAVPDGVKQSWQVQLTGHVTPPVAAGGFVLVAERDTHTVHAFQADSGKLAWQYTAGGRVDSPPTICGSLALFGSADGRVYCLRLSDGAEVWRFLAAPCDRRVGALGQIESAWPVHGSVLVQKNIVYFTAGRSSFLDGGIYVYGLDAETGKVLHQARLDGPRSDPQKDQGGAGYMDGAKSDILTSDGSDIYLFQERFGGDLKRYPSPMQKKAKESGGFRVYPPAPQRGSSGKRLLTTHGFLSDVDNEGKYWAYSGKWPGWSRHMGGIIHCQLLAFDTDTLYGLQVFTESIRVRRGRHLGGKGQRLLAHAHNEKNHKKHKWSVFIKMHIKGMVVAGKKIFIAGTPNAIPDSDPLAGIEGRLGTLLKTVSATDGEVLSELKLSAPPVLDGLIAANGRLYVSTRDGKVTCLAR
ncbi:MAG: PQQ-binding-like beta-propeller repeat protein [Phycisphaerae bacterium]|nr:PQQ-binding-like beta-propeller repeat protein [Phycisphaerae bacterium]